MFFGTPDFAVPTLAELCRSGREPVLVVSQPDRPVGRGRRLRRPPVAAWAVERGLEVLQPERVREAAFLDTLREADPALAVVVAFGQIFPRALLDLPGRGCVNLHASLLPRWRGAAPIQAAIAAGDATTGVTTMVMEEGLDTGPILLQEELEIGPSETAGELAERLAAHGADLVTTTIDRLERGGLEPRPQNDAAATRAPMLKKSDGRIDWSWTAREIFDRLRGFTPWPGVSAELRGERVKILWARPLDEPDQATDPTTGEPSAGAFLGLTDEGLLVSCGGGSRLAVERLQRPGKRAMTAAELVNGFRLEIGERLL